MEQKVLDTLSTQISLAKNARTSIFLPCESRCEEALAASGCPSLALGIICKSGRHRLGDFYAFSLFERRPPSSLLPTVMGFSLFSQYWGLILCHWLTAPYPPSVYSLPPFCLHRSSVLPKDQGTWRAAAPEGGGPVEGRQVGRVNWAGASHA